MPARLYGIVHSHAAHAARLMLERKGIEHDVVNLLPGAHSIALVALGFRSGTVPAVRLDGRRVQGTLRIAQALEELRPEPSLYPGDPERRRAVQEAERWGHDVLQGVPRRLFRWGLQHREPARTWMAGAIMHLPAPRVAGAACQPVGALYARISKADAGAVRADLDALPGLLDHCDALVADGVLGGAEVNAADCQILPSLRLMLAMDDLRPRIDGRPCARAARALLPEFAGPIPAFLPVGWLTS